MTRPKKPTQVNTEAHVTDDARTDALVDEVLRSAHQRAGRPMSTEKSIRDGEDFTAQMRRDAAVALLSRIERKVLLTEDELLDQLDISHRSLMAAVKAGAYSTLRAHPAAAATLPSSPIRRTTAALWRRLQER